MKAPVFPRRTARVPGRPLIALTALGAFAWLGSFQGATSAQAQLPAGSLDGVARGHSMALYAKGFLTQLDATQRDLASTGIDNPERTTWAFGPVRREGIRLDQLSPAHFGLLEALLDTTLSDAGMEAWHQVRELENVLRKKESTAERIATHRDPNLYWLRIYGTPDPAQHWSWRFEGHHLALHVTCKPHKVPTVTPFFLGANPLFDTDLGPDRKLEPGVTAFTDLNTALQQLVGELDDKSAMETMPALMEEGPQKRPGDIRMGPGRPELPAPSGAKRSELSGDAVKRLDQLLATYLGLLEPDLRQFDLGTAGTVHFSRWGGTELTAPRTWSILTDTFALELATTDGPHHVHALLRDISRDFGGQ